MRLFLALALPDELREEIDTWVSGQPSLAGWRWVRPAEWHVTLRFLGWTDPEVHRRALAVWADAAASVAPFTVRLGDVGCFPPRGEPRVLWVAIEELPRRGRLAELAEALETRAGGLGFPVESRPFQPHLTLARRATGARPDPPEDCGMAGRASAVVQEVVLYESHIESGGARYTALDRFRLGGGTLRGGTRSPERLEGGGPGGG